MNRKRERRGTMNRNAAITSQTPSQSIPSSPKHQTGMGGGAGSHGPVMNGGMTGSSDAKTASGMGASDRGESSTLNGGASALAEPSMEGSRPAMDAEPGTLKASLAATPGWLQNGCQDISSYTLSTYAISTVAISTAHNFNLLHFQPSAISTYTNFG